MEDEKKPGIGVRIAEGWKKWKELSARPKKVTPSDPAPKPQRKPVRKRRLPVSQGRKSSRGYGR
jgi:hypothetical protein